MTEFMVGNRVQLNEQGAEVSERPVGTEAKIHSLYGNNLFRLEFEDGTVEGLYDLDEFVILAKDVPVTEKPDMVNHPPHYKQYGCEVIEITEHMTFNRGNAVKYIARAAFKGSEIEDLEKAKWYIEREIARLGKEGS